MLLIRPLLRVLVVASLVLSTQGLLLVQGTFLLRQDFVITNLCENQNRPELKCDGKCFLTKQLKEQREREDERSAASLEIMLSASSLVIATTGLAALTVRVQPYGHRPSPELASALTGEVFHPPRG